MANFQNRSHPKRLKIDRLTLILGSVFLVLAIITGVVLFQVARDMFRTWTITPLDGIPVDSGGIKTGDGTPVPADIALQPVEGPTAEAWDGTSRITVLIMGLDYRDWEAGETPRTDTMMLFTLDPLSRTAGMLSVPRDMWVNIPGFDYGKINTAYFLGEANKMPGGGPGLAVETVKQFLGVPINYYAQVDFMAFVKFIDEIGGVLIDVDQEMIIDPVGPSPKVNLTPGQYTLNGELALAYARQRHTDGGDFDRAKRQQQVVMAIRNRILQYDQMPKLVAKAPKLYNDLSAGIRTNMTLNDIIKLAWLAQQIPPEDIKSVVIGTDAVEFGKSPDGLDILKPIPDKVRLVRDQVFTTGGPVGPAAVAQDPKELMTQEAARISIQNGTYTAGLAGVTAEFLRNEGINVVDENNADQNYDVTTIFIYNGKPYTVQYLISKMQLQNPRIYNRYDPNAPYDIAIALGNDWAQSGLINP